MPDDPTPLGDAMTHRFPEQKIPQKKPAADEARRGGNERRPHEQLELDIDHRPSLPDHRPPGRQRG